MLNQITNGRRNTILLLFFVGIIAICSSSPALARQRRGAGAGNCNGGRNTYKTFCYGNSNGDAGREADVQNCFNKLQSKGVRYGCYTESQGRCRCTADSPYIFDRKGTIGEARQRLYEQCHGFTNGVMERYEGNLYLTATCD